VPETTDFSFWDLACLLAANDRHEGRLSRLQDAIFERRADPKRLAHAVGALEDDQAGGHAGAFFVLHRSHTSITFTPLS
jgi:hypothetical protein